MKTLSATLVVLLSFTLINPSYCQESKDYKTNNIYVVWDLNDTPTHMTVDAEVTITDVSAYTTIGRVAFSMAEKSCFYKGGREVQKEGKLTRVITDCVSGGSFIVTSRPGKTKFAFTNSSSTGKHGDSFNSGVFYTDYSPESIADLIFW